MKKKSLRIFWLTAILLLTAVAVVLHLTTRETVPNGYIQLAYVGKEEKILLSDLTLQQVQGTISSAKGTQRTIDSKGISVEDFLHAADIADFTSLTVTGDDEYSAELTADEVAEEANTYFILQENGGIQLIVFHDTNSKRCVSDVARVEVK